MQRCTSFLFWHFERPKSETKLRQIFPKNPRTNHTCQLINLINSPSSYREFEQQILNQLLNQSVSTYYWNNLGLAIQLIF